MKKLSISLLLMLFLGGFRADKVKLTADNKASSILFSMHHPLHAFEASSKAFKCVGAFDNVTNNFVAIAVIVPVKSFDSGNSNRDSHIIEVTEALKYPNVSFGADAIEYAGNDVTASGSLTFHGVKRPFKIKGVQQKVGDKITLSGKFEVNMKDFGIEPPGLVGMKTDKIIKLDYIFTFNL